MEVYYCSLITIPTVLISNNDSEDFCFRKRRRSVQDWQQLMTLSHNNNYYHALCVLLEFLLCSYIYVLFAMLIS